MLSETHVVYFCDECGEEVEDRTGAICVHDVNKAQRAIEAWEDEHRPTKVGALPVLTGAEYMTRPRRAAWKVYHYRCHEGGNGNTTYMFDIERARRWPDLLQWSAHLSLKAWVYEYSDWASFLEKVLFRWNEAEHT